MPIVTADMAGTTSLREGEPVSSNLEFLQSRSHRAAAHGQPWLTPAYFANPYPYYDELLASNEVVHWNEALGHWVIVRYEPIVSALRNPELFSSKGVFASHLNQIPEASRPQFKPLYDHFSVGLIVSDPPDHTRLRGLVNKVFTPKAVANLRLRVEALVNELLDQVEEKGRIDVVADFAFPLPATVISEILGVPVKDRERIKQWSASHVRISAASFPLVQCAPDIQRNLLELREYMGALIDDRRDNPQDDLLSQLIQSVEQGEKLTHEELLSSAVTILIAGHETTTNLIASAMLLLLRHPDQLQQLRSNPELAQSAIEEVLRYESPIQRIRRVVKQNTEMPGGQMKKGEVVSMMIGAANRDARVFRDPHRFDITRQNNCHLAFGSGVHFCLGAALARLEGPIAINAMIRRFPEMQLEADHVRWRHDATLRALNELPVRWL